MDTGCIYNYLLRSTSPSVPAVLADGAVLVSILGLVGVGVKLHRFGVDIHGLLGLTHHLECIGFPKVSLDKGWVDGDTGITILQDKVKGVQLGVTGSTIGEDLSVIGIPLEGLRVVFDRISPVAGLKGFVALEFLFDL